MFDADAPFGRGTIDSRAFRRLSVNERFTLTCSEPTEDDEADMGILAPRFGIEARPLDR